MQPHASSGVIRKLWPGDRPAFEAHLLRLDQESRRARFAMAVSNDFLISYAARSFELGSVTFGYVEAGLIRGAAEMRPLDRHGEAEAAFSVEPHCRHAGIGTALFSRLVLAARNRRMKRLYMSCMARNRAMQNLARKFEAELVFEAEDVLGIVSSYGPTPASMLDEAMADAQGFATAILHLQTRWFQRPR
jgi:GNAT superfamily N-acetyltransferase